MPDGKKVLTGYQRNEIIDLSAAVGLSSDEDLVRCITPNEQEDFLLLNRKELMMRSFCNIGTRNSNKMAIEKCRRIKISELDKKSKDGLNNMQKLGTNEIHTAVGSKDDKFILLFSRFDLIKMKVDVREQTAKEKKSGHTHKV
jgi:hypothetical protein